VNEKGNLLQFFGTGNLQALERTSNSIANRAFALVDTSFPNYSSATPITVTSLRNATSTCPNGTQQGWYVNYGTNEKTSARATIKNKTLYLSRFTPNVGDVCQAGTSKLTEHDFVCGTTTRSTSLGGGVATEAVIYKNKVYVGISDDRSSNALPDGFTKKGNLIVGSANQAATGKVEVESWWEDFQ
jgi:hypothetical protein